jgi:hypothetical protein
MGASLTALSISSRLKITAIFLQGLAGLFRSRRVMAKESHMKTKTKDDLEDLPMAYLWYVVLAIMAIVAAAVAVVIRRFYEA